jgi:hypothetical protein
LFGIIFIVSLLVNFQVQSNLLTTCTIVGVSRCMFVIPGTNIGGGAGRRFLCGLTRSYVTRTSCWFVGWLVGAFKHQH